MYQRAKREAQLAKLNVIGFFGLILINVVIAVIGTQYSASMLGYSRQLGEPMFWHCYTPGSSILWMFKFGTMQGKVREILMTDGLIELGGHALTVVPFVLYMMRARARFQAVNEVHGSAHFADPKEVKATELLSDGSGRGIQLGAWTDPKGRDIYLTHKGIANVLVYAPSRSKKGASIVVPTLLGGLEDESVFANDAKGELWQLTSGYRSEVLGHACVKFDPVNSDTACYDPLNAEALALGTDLETLRIQTVSHAIIPTGKQVREEGLDDHWTMTARSFVSGLIAHVVYTEPDATLGRLSDILAGIGQPLEEYLTEALEVEHRDYVRPGYGWPYQTNFHPLAVQGIGDYLATEPRQRSGILTSAQKWFAAYRHIPIRRATSRSDFLIGDLMNGDRLMSLYFVVAPAFEEILRPLKRVMIAQMIQMNTEKLVASANYDDHAYKYRLRMVLDEFPSIGRLDIIPDSMAHLVGYGISLLLICQDVAQIWETWGKHETITGNCDIRVAYTPNKLETAEHLSENLGPMTERVTNKNFTGTRASLYLTHVIASEQDVGRDLMKPDELLRMDTDKCLIFKRGHTPIEGKIAPYYEDPEFMRRARIPAPPTDTIPHPELKVDFERPKPAKKKKPNTKTQAADTDSSDGLSEVPTAEMVQTLVEIPETKTELQQTAPLAPSLIEEAERQADHRHHHHEVDHGLEL